MDGSTVKVLPYLAHFCPGGREGFIVSAPNLRLGGSSKPVCRVHSHERVLKM